MYWQLHFDRHMPSSHLLSFSSKGIFYFVNWVHLPITGCWDRLGLEGATRLRGEAGGGDAVIAGRNSIRIVSLWSQTSPQMSQTFTIRLWSLKPNQQGSLYKEWKGNVPQINNDENDDDVDDDVSQGQTNKHIGWGRLSCTHRACVCITWWR